VSRMDHATPGIVLLLFFVLGCMLFFIRRAKTRGEDVYIRRIPGIDAIHEATGRAAELGRPISFCTGLTSLGPVAYACLGVLSAVARRAARYKTRLLLPQTAPEVMALTEETVRDAYYDAGRSDLFDPKSLLYLSDDQFAFASGYMGLMHREKVGSAFLFGEFKAESLLLADAGRQVGAMQVAASVDPDQVAFFICTCDYTLIGEELFAASAYLGRDPIQVGSLVAQDVVKLLFFLLLVIGVLFATWAHGWGIAHTDLFQLIFGTGWDFST
jgi:hypothetical protein